MSLLNFLIDNKDVPLNNFNVCRYIMDIEHEYDKPYKYEDNNLFIYCMSLDVIRKTIFIISNYKIVTVLRIGYNLDSYRVIMRTIDYDGKTMDKLIRYTNNYDCYGYKNKIDELLANSSYDEITFGAFLPSKVKSSCSTIN